MKQAKIAIIVVCLIGAAVLFISSLTGGGPRLDNDSTVINVLTGEIKKMERSEMSVIPFPDAEGRRVIVPAMRNDDGEWSVAGRFRGAIPNILEREGLSESDLAIDMTTFTVK
jgi:hypothetical protein